jgi:hypothetical protein
MNTRLIDINRHGWISSSSHPGECNPQSDSDCVVVSFTADADIWLPDARLCYLKTVGITVCDGWIIYGGEIHNSPLDNYVGLLFDQEVCVTPVVTLFAPIEYYEPVQEVSPKGPTLCFFVDTDLVVHYTN